MERREDRIWCSNAGPPTRAAKTAGIASPPDVTAPSGATAWAEAGRAWLGIVRRRSSAS